MDITPESQARLTVWISGPVELAAYSATVADFQKLYPGLTINLEDVPAVDARARLETRGPAGTGPDVFATPHDQLGDLSASGLIMPNLIYSNTVKAGFLDSALSVLSFEGKLMAFPVSMETLVMFTNKNLFPQAPATWEDLLSLGRPLTDVAKGHYGFLFPIGDLYVCYPFLATSGAYVFGNGGRNPEDIGLANAGGVKGLETMLKLREISLKNAGDATWDSVQGLFLHGRVGAILQGPWAMKELSKAGFPLGVAPLPLMTGQRPSTFSGIMVLAVSSYSRFPKAAQLFAAFATSEKQLCQHFAKTGQIPPLKAFLQDETLSRDPLVKPFLDQLQASQPMPNIKEMKYLWVPMAAALRDAWDGKESPRSALDKALTTIKEQILFSN